MATAPGIHPEDCRDYPSLSQIERDTGVDRRDIKTLVVSNDIPRINRPPAILVTPEGMRRLLPIIEDFKAKQEATDSLQAG